MSPWTATARQALNAARLSSSRSSPAASLIHRRGLAGSSDSRGRRKMNFWEKPLDPTCWKREQYAFIMATGWALLCTEVFKIIIEEKEAEEASDAKLQIQFKTEE